MFGISNFSPYLCTKKQNEAETWKVYSLGKTAENHFCLTII